MNPYSDLHFVVHFLEGGVFGSKKYIFNDQIKNVNAREMFLGYINTALDMFKKDDVGSHSFTKNDLHFGGHQPVYYILLHRIHKDNALDWR